MKSSQPSDFTKFPFGSVLQNNESEQVAVNVMVILKRTGNTFRELPFKEYKAERMKDGASASNIQAEKSYFDKIIRYCKNSDTAALFAPAWEKP